MLKSYLVMLAHVLVGLVVLLLSDLIKLPTWINTSIIVFIVFLSINLFDIRIFKLQKAANEFWSLRKLPYLFYGLAAGLIIAAIPAMLAALTGIAPLSDITFNTNFSITAIGLTLVIVMWEELWFRGLFLNYSRKYLSVSNMAIMMGLLFMLIHMFNPEIDLLQKGPTLFFAGGLLTLLYFHYRNIWICIGLHFGNNFLSAQLSVETEHPFFNANGYLYALVLGVLFIIFFYKSCQGRQMPKR